MLLTSTIAIFLIAWSSIFLVDYVLRSRNFEPYIRFVNRYGIEISPFQLRFYIHQNSDLIESVSLIKNENEVEKKSAKNVCFKSSFLKIWFAFGALVSVICLFGITFYMTHILLKDFTQWMSTRQRVMSYRGMEYRSMQQMLMMTSPIPPTTAELKPIESNVPIVVTGDDEYDLIEDGQKNHGGLMPIIPGFNLPFNHIPIFMIVLIIAAIFHELGHAWAATSNGVTVNGFGIFVFGLYPGAFTDIEPVSLKRSSNYRKMQIFGAGIWHNLFLALIAVGMFNAAPSLMSPLLVEGLGVSIKGVDSRSGLAGGSTGLHPGDVVSKIDECQVATLFDWLTCIRTAKTQNNGRCVEKETVESATAYNTWTSSDEIHCCDEFNVTNAHLCFERQEKVVKSQTKATKLDAIFGIEKTKTVEETETKYSCMNARQVLEQPICNSSLPCEQSEKENICVYPALFNGTRLVRIGLSNRPKPILFVGHISELLDMVAVDGHTSRFWFADVSWLDHFQLSAKYLFTLSLALGLLNAMPCYALDGQFLVATMLHFFSFSLRRRALIRYLVLCFGTSVLALNIVAGFIRLAFSQV
ncbi:unnamed protein product [Caenorhabditis bovis]|uniref:Membrane-bound transcription factor site-2 protease n=1 Tax=Caenorhabditis bovis TaxID=2654633 RepID=A0A8S1EN01_9PELO|nr:unnamed protein product [Caenorhabditis bovis]